EETVSTGRRPSGIRKQRAEHARETRFSFLNLLVFQTSRTSDLYGRGSGCNPFVARDPEAVRATVFWRPSIPSERLPYVTLPRRLCPPRNASKAHHRSSWAHPAWSAPPRWKVGVAPN